MTTIDPDIEGLRAELAALADRVSELEAAARATGAMPPHRRPADSPPHADSAPAVVPPVAPPPRRIAAPRTVPADAMSLESQIGSQWLNRIGIVAVLIGVSYFLRYAFENDWIGPAGRVSVGLLAGASVVLWSERFRARGYLAFSWSLKAVGIGALYLSLWAGFQLYSLVPVEVAFAAMVAVTAATAVLALRQEAGVLAGFALLGGYATPVLLSTGDNRPIELFVYVALLNAGALAIVAHRPWLPLIGGAFAGTTSLYVGWYAVHFAPPDRPVALTFATLFFATFASVPLVARYPDSATDRAAEASSYWKLLAVPVLLLLPVANAGVYFLQLVALLQPSSRNFPPAAALGLAAAYIALARLIRRRRADVVHAPVLALLHAAVAIGLVTIAIPLRLEANWVTIGWLAEAALLLWIAERTGARVVRRFGVVALALAILRLVLIDNYRTTTFLLNERFLTFAAAIGLLAAIAWTGRARGSVGLRALALTTTAVHVLALLALTREAEAFFRPPSSGDYQALQTTAAARDFAYSAIWIGYGAIVMIWGFRLRWPALRWQALTIVGLATIKVFVYDLSNLDAPFRILSFIALGLVLMGISFAYQRDWLKLRGGAAQTDSAESA